VYTLAGSMDKKGSDNSQRKKKRSRSHEKSDIDEDFQDSIKIWKYQKELMMNYQVMNYHRGEGEGLEDARRSANEFHSKHHGAGAEKIIQKRLRQTFQESLHDDIWDEHSGFSDYNLTLHYTDFILTLEFESTGVFNECMRGLHSRGCFHDFNMGGFSCLKDISAQVTDFFGNVPDLADEKDVYIKWHQQQLKEALTLRLDNAVSEPLCKSLLLLRDVQYLRKTNEEAKTENVLSDQELADPRKTREDIVGSLVQVVNVRRLDMIRIKPTWVVTYVTSEGNVQKSLFEMQVVDEHIHIEKGYASTILTSDQQAKAELFRHSNRESSDLLHFTSPWITEDFKFASTSSIVGLVNCADCYMSGYCNPPFVLWIDGVDPLRQQIVLSQTALRKCIDTFILCIQKSMAKEYFLPMSIYKKIGEMLTGAKPKADLNAVVNAQSVLQSYISDFTFYR
jgi:hypothetical protein